MNALIERIKSEGILNDILQTIPVKRPLTGVGKVSPLDQQYAKAHLADSKRLEAKTSSSLAAKIAGKTSMTYHIEPNKRYLSVRLVSIRALVDFLTPKDDEFIYCSISFLK